MEHNSVGRRTRLQEKKYFEKYYEEKCEKKFGARSRDSYRSSRKEECSRWDKDLKRRRVLEGSNEPEEVVICSGDEAGRGSLHSTQKRGLEEIWNCGDNDGDAVFLREEVVSNHNSSRVPSSLGSGMNSGCARGGKSSLESLEVVSSCLRREGEYILLSDDSSESGGKEDEDDKGCKSVEVEEEHDDNDDEYADAGVDGRRRVSRSGESNVDDLFLGDEKAGESSKTLEEGNNKGKKQKQVIEDGLIRKKVYGIDILSTSSKKDNSMSGGIAKRLRSRFLSESKRKLLKLGTISRPVIVDKLESSSDSEDKRPPVVNYKPESSSDSEDTFESSTDSEDESESQDDTTNTVSRNKMKIDRMEIRTLKKRMENWESQDDTTNTVSRNKVKIDRMEIRTLKKRMENWERKTKIQSTSKLVDLEKIISEKIWQEAYCTEEKIHCKLPLKFTFEDEDLVVQEKEECEKEIEALFDEMEFALKAIEIGSFGPSVDDCSDKHSSETEREPSAVELCRKGKHNLKLEEDIGLICRNCSYVLEMKYVFPEFAKDPFKKWGKKSLAADTEIDCSLVDRLKFAHYYRKGNSSVDVEGTVWDLIPGMKENMYPHQHEGFEFIWELLAGGISLEKLMHGNSLSNEGNGCIINHAPGTGKTYLVIMFLLSFMRLYPKCKPIIVAPYSMLRNWEDEFKKWNVDIPFYNLNNELSLTEYEKATKLFGNEGVDKNCSRMFKLYFWRQEQSVLAISYPLFVKLAGEHVSSEIGEENKKAKNGYTRKILLELSDIVVLDEGHVARNEKTQIWRALSEVKTKRRVILSGTLFQNNFNELYNTLCLANPNFADQMNESRGFRKRHRQDCDLSKEEWLSLTNSIVWKGGDVAKIKDMNYPFVHVYKGAILLELPGMKDSRIDLRPTALQAKLLNIVKKLPNLNYLRRKSLMSSISIHPSLVSNFHEFSEDVRCNLRKLLSNPAAGVKTKFVFELIRLCEVLHERVLIFCTYVKPLKLIMNQLKSQFDWVEEREVLQMDGSADQERRKSVINSMNDPDSNVRVLLASTKASNEGISLVGASRVVILDVGFNPSVETQAISRAYRIGQKKVVHVYHLITSGTLEVDNYHSQNLKEHISKLVFSSKNSSGCRGSSNGEETVNPEAAVLQDKVLESMVQHENLQDMFDQIYERPRID